MIDTLTSTPFFGLGVTLLCWYLAVRFQKRTGLLICNPVLVASLLVIGIMLLFHIPLDNYNAGGSIIKLLLAPATAVLALNIYQQRAILKRHFWPVVLGCFVGSLVSMLLVQVLCRLFQAEASLLNSLLPKSVTTAIAVSIAESSGGLPALTAASVIITGIEGAMLAPLFAKVFHVTDPVVEGVAIGACSHAMGTAKALELGETEGAMSGLAIGLCGMDGQLFQAEQLDEKYGLVGKITGVNPEPVENALLSGYIPVVSTVAQGTDADCAYNINADTAAAKLAVALKAEKLILLTDVRGLLRDPKDDSTLISELQLSSVPALVREGVISGGMIPKVDCCVEAVRSGVDSAIILDGRVAHSILIELLSDAGIGTMLVH